MKSLRETRIEKGITRLQLENFLGITQANLSQIESGEQMPNLLTRKRLEECLGEKINWLDTIFINSDGRPCEWYSAERNFRSCIRDINGLPEDEKSEFIKSALKHLRRILNTHQLQNSMTAGNAEEI